MGLLQREVAERIGVHEQTLRHWEAGQTDPVIQWLPGIFLFLGYDPRQVPEGIGPRLQHLREGLGISQEAMARELGVDPGTLGRWESGQRKPKGKYLAKVHVYLGNDPRTRANDSRRAD